MTAFVFELDAVLEIRRRECDAHRQLLAQLERECLLLEDEIDIERAGVFLEREELRQELARYSEGFEDSNLGGVDLTRVQMQANASLAAISVVEIKVRRMEALHEQIDRTRMQLMESSVRLQAIEKLRQRRYDEWMSAIERHEAREADDMTVMRAGRIDDIDFGLGQEAA